MLETKTVLCVKWKDPDDLNWADVFEENVTANCDIVDSNDKIIILFSDNESMLVFGEDSFIFVGNAAAFTEKLPFISLNITEDGNYTLEFDINYCGEGIIATYNVMKHMYIEIPVGTIDTISDEKYVVGFTIGELMDKDSDFFSWKEFLREYLVEGNLYIVDKNTMILLQNQNNTAVIFCGVNVCYVGFSDLYLSAGGVIHDNGDNISIRNNYSGKSIIFKKDICIEG